MIVLARKGLFQFQVETNAKSENVLLCILQTDGWLFDLSVELLLRIFILLSPDTVRR